MWRKITPVQRNLVFEGQIFNFRACERVVHPTFQSCGNMISPPTPFVMGSSDRNQSSTCKPSANFFFWKKCLCIMQQAAIPLMSRNVMHSNVPANITVILLQVEKYRMGWHGGTLHFTIVQHSNHWMHGRPRYYQNIIAACRVKVLKSGPVCREWWKRYTTKPI